MKSSFLCLIGLCIGLFSTAQDCPIIPRPNQYIPQNAPGFTLGAKTGITYSSNAEKAALEAFNALMLKTYGFSMPLIKTGAGSKPVAGAINVAASKKAGSNAEAYELTINSEMVTISHSEKGLMHALMSVFQLLPPEKMTSATLPACYINDAPRFAYRGMHLDAGRYFMPVDFVKKYIDYIAIFKFNTFHWHLTEDQGWRIEIKKYPLLTQVGAWRDGTIIGRHPGTGNTSQRTGGFYSQKEIREIVAYATARNITIIPEIELPGHSSAAIAAYPWLSCFPNERSKLAKFPSAASNARQAFATSATGRDTSFKIVQETWGVFDDVFCPSDSTFKFLEDVMDEVMALFPAKYIHIGGDECPKTAWKRSAFCQQLIKEKGLVDEHGLQSYFIGRVEKYLNSKGRQIIGWDEILEGGLAPNASVMSWRGEEGGIAAAKQHHNVVMTPGNWVYLDHSQTKNEDSLTIGGYTPLREIYAYEPLPPSLSPDEAKYILGAQGNVWTEYMPNPSKVEYMIFPRMAALSEVIWTNKELRSLPQFESRVPGLFKRLTLMGTNYSKAFLTGAD